MNARRLLKLAKFLDVLPRRKFFFGSVISKSVWRNGHVCGTVCCAIGWAPVVFPRLAAWVGDGDYCEVTTKTHLGLPPADTFVEAASQLFEIPLREAADLFSPGPSDVETPWGSFLRNNATPKQVAKQIRAYVAWKRKSEATA